MKKIRFDRLIVETTRKCNLHCGHCCNGDAQPVDISKEVLDAILDKTSSLKRLQILGGEPLCNESGLIYLLKGVVDKNIPVGFFSFVTNGTILSLELCNAIKDLYYKNHCIIDVSISKDKYHVDSNGNQFADKAFTFYENEIGDIAKLTYSIGGIAPKKVGRAVNIANAVHPSSIFENPRRIEYRTKDNPFCNCMQLEKIEIADNEVVIECPIVINAFGNMRSLLREMPFPEQDRKKVIMNILDDRDIIEAIETYNDDFEIPSCIENIMIQSSLNNRERALQDMDDIKYFLNSDLRNKVNTVAKDIETRNDNNSANINSDKQMAFIRDYYNQGTDIEKYRMLLETLLNNTDFLFINQVAHRLAVSYPYALEHLKKKENIDCSFYNPYYLLLKNCDQDRATYIENLVCDAFPRAAHNKKLLGKY